MSAPVLFLDVDGVLNHERLFRARAARRESGKPIPHDPPGVSSIDPACVRRLQRLVDTSGAGIVVSSTWRCTAGGTTHKVVEAALAAHGFRGRYIGATRELRVKSGSLYLSVPRGREIQRWLDDQPEQPSSFVILDDEGDMEHLKPRLVQTSFKDGLLDKHVDRAIAMLGGAA